jgi:hypothetical protein
MPLKSNTLQKHFNGHKVIVAMYDIVVGKWFYNKDTICNKNERIYIGIWQ